MNPVSQKAPTTIERFRGKLRSPRSTFTEQNAEQFRIKLFDVVIESGLDQMVAYESFAYSPSTLRIKIHDALAWLAENHVDEKYRLLKNAVKIRQEARGITVRFKDHFDVAPLEVISKQWKEELVTFLGEAELGISQEWTVTLGEEDQILVAGLCADVAVYKYENGKLRVMKGT
jgi:hypothetical protein